MKNIIIFYSNLVNEDQVFTIGGIQTYIQLLVSTLKTNFNIKIVQCSEQYFEYKTNDYEVCSLGHNNPKKAVKFIEKSILNNQSDILLFASEQFSYKTKWKNTIVIQHGIYWDLSLSNYKPKYNVRPLSIIYKFYENYRNLRRISPFSNIVCVDNNYINWYRALSNNYTKKRFFQINNCAAPNFFKPYFKNNKSNVKILFARRFVEMRGVKILIELVKKILHDFPNVSFIIAGEGPLEYKIRQELLPSNRVTLKKVDYANMPYLMNEVDIVIVPSLGSEGTSLSAIEAMASSNLVLASNVGGLTNIIIDGYNGVLVNPTLDNFYNSLVELLSNPETISNIRINAKKVADNSFTHEKWSKKWIEVLNTI